MGSRNKDGDEDPAAGAGNSQAKKRKRQVEDGDDDAAKDNTAKNAKKMPQSNHGRFYQLNTRYEHFSVGFVPIDVTG